MKCVYPRAGESVAVSIIVIASIGSCFERSTSRWLKRHRASCNWKTRGGQRRQRTGGGGDRVEEGRLCDGLRIYPMIGNLASEKLENLIPPFASTGKHVTVFPIKEQSVWAERARLADWLWYNVRRTRDESERVTILSRSRTNAKVFNFWSFSRRTVRCKGIRNRERERREPLKERRSLEDRVVTLFSPFFSYFPFCCLFFYLFPCALIPLFPLLYMWF